MGFDIGDISAPDRGATDEATGIGVDRFGRYRLPVPPTDRNAGVTAAGGPLRSYSRATTISSSMEYRGNLEAWTLRETVHGVSLRPDLVLKAQGSGDDRRALDEVVAEAQAVSGMHKGRNAGTGMHGVTTEVDNLLTQGNERSAEVWSAIESLADLAPVKYRGDVLAYARLAAEVRIRPPTDGGKADELIVVHPDLMIAGRFDKVRIIDSELVIVDAKTQKDEPGKYGQLPIAMQLAIYAHAPWIYDDTNPAAPCWRPAYPVSKRVAYVIWLPSGTGRAKLIKVDIARAWLWVETAMKVRESRNVKDLYFPFAEITVPDPVSVEAPSTPTQDPAPMSQPASDPVSVEAPPTPTQDPAPTPQPGPGGIIPAVKVAGSAKPKAGGRRCGKCGGTGHNARTCSGGQQQPCAHTHGWRRDPESEMWVCAGCGAPGVDPRMTMGGDPAADMPAPRSPGPDGAVQVLREATPTPTPTPTPAPATPWQQPESSPDPDEIPPERIPPGLEDQQLPVLREILGAKTADDLTKIYDAATRSGLWSAVLMEPAQSRYLELTQEITS